MTATLRARLLRGDILHMEFGPAGPRWWFEAPYQQVDAVELRLVRPSLGMRLECLAPSLFGEAHTGQSWRVSKRRGGG